MCFASRIRPSGEQASRVAAREAIEALRDGTVPRAHVATFTVGRGRHLAALVDDLRFIADGGYKVRFLVGDWGFGKTHLLALLGAAASSRGLAISHVELHSRDAPLERSEVITAAILRNTVFPGGQTIEDYLADWSESADLRGRSEIDQWLREASASLELRAVLLEALGGASSRGWDPVADGARWLTGGEASPSLSRATGIRGAMKARVAQEVLTSFLSFLRASGSPGLLLMLDEAEAITSLTTASRREEANQTLKRFLDNPEGRSGWEVVFATTRRFIDDETRGARSYPALWERIRTLGPPGAFNPRATVLELGPLEEAEILALGEHLRDLHGAAYQWKPSLGRPEIASIATAAFKAAPSRPPRRFVRALISSLDLMESEPDKPIADILEAVEGIGQGDE